MHGKDLEISQGFKMLFPNREEDFVDYEEFGFDIILEQISKNNTNESELEDNERTEYESGRISKKSGISYTDDSLIYQSILKYSTSFGTKGYFRSRKISEDWLLEKCSVYIKHYEKFEFKKTPKKVRIEHINHKVTLCLEKLRYLELLDSRNVLADNKEETLEYRFTDLGLLLGLLIEYLESPTRSLVDKIFTQSITFYNNQNYAHAKFCSIFFRKCYEKDTRIFEFIIIAKFLEILKNSSKSKTSFYTKLTKFQVFYNHRLLWKIFCSSLNDFESNSPEDSDIFLYEFKLDMEALQESKSRNRKEFERIRFSVYDNPNIITIEGYCSQCRMFTDTATELIEYFQASIEEPNKKVRAPCPNCKPKGGLDFETLEYL